MRTFKKKSQCKIIEARTSKCVWWEENKKPRENVLFVLQYQRWYGNFEAATERPFMIVGGRRRWESKHGRENKGKEK